MAQCSVTYQRPSQEVLRYINATLHLDYYNLCLTGVKRQFRYLGTLLQYAGQI